MRLINIDHVKPHTCLAKTIYDGRGRVLLAKGTKLSAHYVKRLKDLGINSVYVDDGIGTAIEIDDVVSEQTRLAVVQTTRDALLKVQSGRSPESRRIREAVGEIIDEILQSKEVMIHVTDVRSLKDHTFGHSVNVCILSLMTGLAMGYDQSKLKDLGTAALLHDVGKAMIPEYIVNSKRVFTAEEYQVIQRHVDYGFEILRRTDNINGIVAHVAWQHHERYNGKGYPRKLAGQDILEFARIVAIADVHDALSTDRPYRQRMLPHEVVEIIRGLSGIDFDPEIAALFVRNIAPYPMGSIVLLNSGCKGIVVRVKKDFPTRPQIRLLYDAKGNMVEGEHVVDLMKELTIFITDVVRE